MSRNDAAPQPELIRGVSLTGATIGFALAHEGRMVALVGDAELDEGNIFEALLESLKTKSSDPLFWLNAGKFTAPFALGK